MPNDKEYDYDISLIDCDEGEPAPRLPFDKQLEPNTMLSKSIHMSFWHEVKYSSKVDGKDRMLKLRELGKKRNMVFSNDNKYW